jgi:hypothetical protein
LHTFAARIATAMFKSARKIVHAMVVLALVSAPAMSLAQNAPGMGMGAGGPSGDIPRFIELGPKVGEPLPDLTIVNDLGQPVNIREMTKGAYSVLVLGCLT